LGTLGLFQREVVTTFFATDLGDREGEPKLILGMPGLSKAGIVPHPRTGRWRFGIDEDRQISILAPQQLALRPAQQQSIRNEQDLLVTRRPLWHEPPVVDPL